MNISPAPSRFSSKPKALFVLLLASMLAVSCRSEENLGQTIEENGVELFVETQGSKKHIMFFGDSITAGLGVNPDEAFPALVQAKIDSMGANYQVSNGGLSGETSSGGLRRIDWMMRDPIDIFIFELGANDGLRGIDLNLTRTNSEKILEAVLTKNPEVKLVIAGMMLPPNLGADYTQEFSKIFPYLSEKFDADLIPFILEDVGGISELNQADGIHPTPKGHQIISNTVWRYLSPLLSE